MSAPDGNGGVAGAPARLLIAADLSPQMLLRVLGVVSRQSIIPHAVSATSGGDQLNVEMALVGLRDETVERVRAQIEAIVGVRWVRDKE